MHTRLFLRPSLALALLPLALAPGGPAEAQTPAPQAVTKPTLTVLHELTLRDGKDLEDNLTVGADGALYGTLFVYGAAGGGTIFKLTQGGLFHKLADLHSQNGTAPDSRLLLMPDGSLMGTAIQGGKSNTGALFLLTPPHRFQTKHEFASINSAYINVRGANPSGALVLGPDGAVYGTASRGGSSGNGVVYRWTAAKGVEVMHDFTDDTRGRTPAGLTLGTDGALYGTTIYGGTNSIGTAYRLTMDGVLTLLHTFRTEDGSLPIYGLVYGPDGAFYGVTYEGGPSGQATAYRLTMDGKFSVVRAFDASQEGTGVGPLTLGPDGSFYSTASEGGPKGGGTVFRMTPKGVVTVLYAFEKNSSAGDGPVGGVTFAPNGDLYGSTFSNGFLTQKSVLYKLRLPK